MHLEACFDQDDHDGDGDDDDDGCYDDGGGDAKTRDLKADLIFCISRSKEIIFFLYKYFLRSSEVLFNTNTFCAPVKYFLIQILFALQ